MKYLLLLFSINCYGYTPLLKVGECYEAETTPGRIAKITGINKTTYSYNIFQDNKFYGPYKDLFLSLEQNWPDKKECP